MMMPIGFRLKKATEIIVRQQIKSVILSVTEAFAILMPDFKTKATMPARTPIKAALTISISKKLTKNLAIRAMVIIDGIILPSVATTAPGSPAI